MSWNLSEKIQVILEGDILDTKDVAKFIQKLKERLKIHHPKSYLFAEIDQLAGDELIEVRCTGKERKGMSDMGIKTSHNIECRNKK